MSRMVTRWGGVEMDGGSRWGGWRRRVVDMGWGGYGVDMEWGGDRVGWR